MTDPAEITRENNPALAAHYQAAEFDIVLSSTKSAYIAEAVLAASGLRERVAVLEAQKQAALKLHHRIEVWMNKPSADFGARYEAGEPSDYQVCEWCSDDEVIGSIEDGNFRDDVSFISWPCATVRALGGEETS